MNKQMTASIEKFNTLSLRERVLSGSTIIVAVGFLWAYFFVAPVNSQILTQVSENDQDSAQVESSRLAVKGIRDRINAGVNKHKEQQLAELNLALKQVEQRLRQKAVELVDPEQMFRLISQFIYKESKLKLLYLKRKEVKPAITPVPGQQPETQIYRHVLELKLSGKYLDILEYMQSLEAIEWKLIWDKIEIVRNDYPEITVEVVISTLSTRKEWVGV